MIVLGVDPGLQATGIALIEVIKRSFRINSLGEIKTKSSEPLARRLEHIYSSLDKIIDESGPSLMVLEKLYSHYRHPVTSSLLGHARGVIVLLAARKNIKLIEYPVTQVKKAVTSYGAASKDQVKRMVSHLAQLEQPPKSQHIADALALTLTYLHTKR